MEDFEDVTKALAYLEIRSVDREGWLVCREKRSTQKLFPGKRFLKGSQGFYKKVKREELQLLQDSLFRNHSHPKIKKGSTLLHEEERVLFLWQRDGSIVVSSEDHSWNNKLSDKSYAAKILLIERSGTETILWKIPQEVLFFKKSFF